MKVPTVIRYGVRMVVTIAQQGGVMSTTQLAKEMGVSPLYLRQLAPALERSGILEGMRGVKGGYRLRRQPREITLLEVIEAFGEDFALLACVKDPGTCRRSATCIARGLWQGLSDEIRSYLMGMTLEGLIEDAIRISRRQR